MKKTISLLLMGGLLSVSLLSCDGLSSPLRVERRDSLFEATAQERYQNEAQYFHKVEMVKAKGSTYARDLLSKRLQEKYDQLDLHVHSFVPEMNHVGVTPEEMKQVMEHYRSDNPQVFWLNGNYEYRLDKKNNTVDQMILSFSYLDGLTQDKIELTQADIEKKNRELQLAADEILARVPETASVYQIVLFFHDELAKTVRYDVTAPFQHTLYGALVQKAAVCDGYASAMQYLLGRVGIKCLMVYGADRANAGENHAWNLVKLEDEYYHLDVTWDLPPQNSDIPVYVNFLADQEQIQQRHVILSPILGESVDTSRKEYFYLPAIPMATCSDKWYYRYHDLCLSDLSKETLVQLGETVQEAIFRQEPQVQFYFESKDVFQEFVQEVQQPRNNIAKYFPTRGYQEMTLSSSAETRVVIFMIEYP